MINYAFQGGPLDGHRVNLPRLPFDVTVRYAPDNDDELTTGRGKLDSDYYRFDDSDESQPAFTWTPCGVWLIEDASGAMHGRVMCSGHAVTALILSPAPYSHRTLKRNI